MMDEPQADGSFREVVEDCRYFFRFPDHWIYTSHGTPSSVSPDSVYHLSQLEVLFEDKHFHFRTDPAIRELREERFLSSEEVNVSGSRAIIVWRSNVRYVRRKINDHLELMARYANDVTSSATGDYAETLTLLGLSRLQLSLVSRNTRAYKGKEWTATNDNLDFIFEKDNIGYGVEVKNTFDYIPQDELGVKLKICKFLGISPLFVVRTRHSGQWEEVKQQGGLIYMFKSKIFPPGYDTLVAQLWRDMRLPVKIMNDWPPQFYKIIGNFIASSTATR